MDTLSQHYRRMVGLNEDWTISDVELDTNTKTLTLALEFVGASVTCPECGASCSKKDHAAERSWRHLDAMQFQTVLTARVPRSACDTCGVKTIAVPWAGKHGRFTLMFEAFAIEVLQASRSVQAAADPPGNVANDQPVGPGRVLQPFRSNRDTHILRLAAAIAKRS